MRERRDRYGARHLLFNQFVSQVRGGSHLAAVSRWAALAIEAVSKPSEFGRLTRSLCVHSPGVDHWVVTRMMLERLIEW